MLGTRTRSGRMEGADESTELKRHPLIIILLCNRNYPCGPQKTLQYSIECFPFIKPFRHQNIISISDPGRNDQQGGQNFHKTSSKTFCRFKIIFQILIE